MIIFARGLIYRLTNETISGNANSTLNGSIDYAYDEVGNRLSRTSTLAAVPSQQNLSVDANDRLTADSYDNNGSTISADGKTYQYDYENRIISVSGNGITISIKYDGDGNRVEKSVTQNGQTVVTKYLVDTNNLTGYAQVVEETQNSVVSRQYSYGLDLISQRQLIGSNRVVHFYGYDGHGSVRYLTDVNGAITDTYDYDAYGLLINQTGNTPNNYLYAGEQYDFDLGLYYNRARYLEVNRGRFWSQDSFEGINNEPASLHKYLYASGDPVNRIDPSGNLSILEKIVVVGLILTLAAAVAETAILIKAYERIKSPPLSDRQPIVEAIEHLRQSNFTDAVDFLQNKAKFTKSPYFGFYYSDDEALAETSVATGLIALHPKFFQYSTIIRANILYHEYRHYYYGTFSQPNHGQIFVEQLEARCQMGLLLEYEISPERQANNNVEVSDYIEGTVKNTQKFFPHYKLKYCPGEQHP